MLDDADLEMNVLDFRGKGFSFERSVDWDGTELALFHRTETESESRFRPRIVRLLLALPKSWLALDASGEALVLERSGTTPRPGPAPAAVETAAESTQFEERGIAWRRQPLSETAYLYLPEEWAGRLGTPEGLARLGVT
jgi:hypothetical protein